MARAGGGRFLRAQSRPLIYGTFQHTCRQVASWELRRCPGGNSSSSSASQGGSTPQGDSCLSNVNPINEGLVGDAPLPTLTIDLENVEDLNLRGNNGCVLKGVYGTIHVAIKFMHDKGERASLREEVNLMRSFPHPHLLAPMGIVECPIRGLGVVFPWATGGTLYDGVKTWGSQEGAIAALASLAAVIADVGAHIHKMGLLHNDIKPSNVLLMDAEGRHPVLADFGLAYRTNNGCFEGLPGMGTPNYMAPECRQRKYSRLSDIFSFGKMLRELTNKLCAPNTGLNVGLDSLEARMAQRLTKLAEECAAHESTERPASFEEVVQRLQEILQEGQGEVRES